MSDRNGLTRYSSQRSQAAEAPAAAAAVRHGMLRSKERFGASEARRWLQTEAPDVMKPCNSGRQHEIQVITQQAQASNGDGQISRL
jgi:hypothetical protein